jgi:hypothetical protein
MLGKSINFGYFDLLHCARPQKAFPRRPAENCDVNPLEAPAICSKGQMN